jgi:type I restriction enzyme M protein
VGVTGDELLAFVNGDLFPTLKDLPLGGQDGGRRHVVREVFEDAYNYMKSGQLMRQVVNKINQVDFNNLAERQHFGDIYEQILNDLQSAGNAGEFYTPRAVIRFIVELVNPQGGETVYDPACGTCGFQAQAYLWMRRAERTIEDHRTLQEHTFYGQEKKPIPALLGLMNMVLHGVTAPRIMRKNTLEENVRQISERYDVIMTNPPFGGVEGRHIQQNFTIQVQATELLFVQHIMKKLKPHDGARCGMVVPEGTLFRSAAFADVKRDLLEQFDLHTIVSLPPGTFAPYSDVKAALLFFERPGPTKEVWYYELPLPTGLKKFTREALSRTSTSPRRVKSGMCGMPIARTEGYVLNPQSARGSSPWTRLRLAATT